ncbi:lipopolysaccharide biosynthesis protein [Geobacter chapellei]|uniref:Lipopolysaccharide biosynthesis protein n=2 Tax=Pelotalea chapellei TaxID=44671 RepID=A0ABS5U5P1_9BACT|nr:lipopolysaccharide biosynthesis protein [Pelotalea chapellei]
MEPYMQQNETPQPPSPQPPSLLDYLEVIAKRWKMIAAITIGAAVITAIITLFMPNIYTAKAMIIPSDDDKGGMGALMAQLGGLAGLAGGAVGAKTTGDLYVTMLKSETLKDPIIDRFKLLDVYEAKYRTDVYKVLDKNAAIALGKKDGVITIAVDDKDPKRAADMANAYVSELGKLASGLNMTGAGNNRAFLEKRIAEARADLSKAEDGLKAFQTKNKAISVTDQAQATIAGVAQLRAQLALKEVELGTFQRQFTDTSQEVKTTKATVASLRSQIAGLEGKGGASSSIPNVGNMPQLGQEYLRLMREFKIQEAVLEMLTKQYEVAKISEVKEVAPFQVLQKAKVPERRSKPVRKKILMIVLVGALAISCVTVLVQEELQREVKNR